jgi:starch synthase (maltosyl-transferring)
MWDFTNLWFHPAYNDQVLVYSKISDARDNVVVVAVNMDPRQAQGCHFEIPLWRLGLSDNASVAVEDLVTGHRFAWTGKTQHVWLDPHHNPYAIWRIVPPGLPS